MEEIPNNHLAYIKPRKWWDIYHINWLAGVVFVLPITTPHDQSACGPPPCYCIHWLRCLVPSSPLVRGGKHGKLLLPTYGGFWMNVIPTPKNGKNCKCSTQITSWESWDMFFLHTFSELFGKCWKRDMWELFGWITTDLEKSIHQCTDNVVSVFPMVFLMAKKMKKQLWIKSGDFFIPGVMIWSGRDRQSRENALLLCLITQDHLTCHWVVIKW